MSKSIHTTYTHVRGLSKIEIDKQLDDLNSFMSDLSKKSPIKNKKYRLGNRTNTNQ